MEATPKQQEFLDYLDANADLPVAWLGSVRAGKTIGAMLALWKHMKQHRGVYAICAASALNREANIMPNMIRILQDEGEAYAEKTWGGQKLVTDYGQILFPLASDAGSERMIQGLTLSGAITDEVLLYPRNFVMQLIARFSLENPLWIMTANKAAPNHWIKTDWIDTGAINVFESGYEDNPHISETAINWWNTLIDGKYRDRMMNNDWASDLGMIGEPVKCKYDKDFRVFCRSVWLDSARYNAIVELAFKGGECWVMGVERDVEIGEIAKRVKNPNSGMWISNIADSKKPPLPFGVVYFRENVKGWAHFFATHCKSLGVPDFQTELLRDFRRWSWVPSGSTSLDFKPDLTSPEVLATVQGFYHLLKNSPAFKMKATQ